MSASWQSIAKAKQAQRDTLIPREWRLSSLPSANTLTVVDVPRTCGVLSDKEIDITESYDATGLAEAIRNKKFSSVEVTTAYCKRASIAQQLTNCLTEILFASALKRAVALDHHLLRYGEVVGPFHGVPISVKDTFKVSSTDASLGIAALCFKHSNTSAHLVDVLLSAGAVIYCKTNIPQTLATLDSINNVFGRTLNPLNRLVTAGGSSGGEGALVAIKGSPLGVGTDIGGSIRVPCLAGGLYGIKPSSHRVPASGQESAGPPNHVGLVACAGPIAHSVRDCELFLRTVVNAQPWLRDPKLIPGPWESASLDTLASSSRSQPLNIGILSTDGLVTPLPPIASLLREVSATLSQSTNIRVHALPTPSSLASAQTLGNKLMGFEGANNMLDLIESTGEPLIPWLQGRFKRRPHATFAEIRALSADADALRADLAQKLWFTPDGRGQELDAIICPIAPHPTPKIDAWNGVGYTIAWNLMDYPAGCVPVRVMEEADLAGELSEEDKKYPLGSWDKANQELWGKTREDRKHYVGTWLCVQVLAPRLQERRLCRAMEAIDRALKEAGGKMQKQAKL